MNRLTISDLEQILPLAIQARCADVSINHLKEFISTVARNSVKQRELTDDEIKTLSTHSAVKFIMVLFFLTKNVSLEYLRRKNKAFNDEYIRTEKLWAEITDLVKKKLLLSREINKYFQEKDHNPKEFDNLLNAAKTITIDDLRSEEFVNNKNHSKFSLYITGTYKYIEVPVADKYNKSDTELYTLHDRKTCFHEGLYDPFKFEESQTWISYRYLNTTPTRKLIDSVFTLKFALAELTVLYLDGTYVKIQASDIPSFLEKHLKNNEINLDLYKSVQKDYPKLFLPPIDLKTLDALYQQLKQLMVHHFQEASRTGKPLLLLLSEVHGSKESFLFHSIILLIANSLAIKHLLVETINVYHAQYGWDAQVTEINTLMSYAKKDLRMQVTDLEAALHYKNHFCPYPYHDIPEPHFGIEARESSWIIDTEQTKEHKVMIVGSGHINNLLKSPLKESHYILPIDCSGDKAFSDMLSISQHHFISLDKKISHLSLDPSVPATVRQK